jgi:4-hydroxybenzoate-CoA ligase
VFLGAIRAGIVPVPLNTLLTSEQYAYVLADCRARVLFSSEALLPVVKDIGGRAARSRTRRRVRQRRARS